MTEEQRAQHLRSHFAKQTAHRTDSVDFARSIASAVPQHSELRELPAEISAIVDGYRGDDYVVVRDQLVIVDGPLPAHCRDPGMT